MAKNDPNTRVPVDWDDGRKRKSDSNPRPGYWNAYQHPSVFGMQNVQGADYDHTVRRHSAFRVFPEFHITPLFRHRRSTRVDCFGFNASVRPVDIRGGFPFLGGS